MDPFGERVYQIESLQLGHAVSKGSLPREENKREVIEFLWGCHKPGSSAQRFQGLDEAADIAASVVDDTNLGCCRQGILFGMRG